MADRTDPAGRTGGVGGVGDGLPALPDGEPLLHRWFVLAMFVLVPIGLVVIVVALLSTDRTPLPPAERRPPGTAEVTHDRGQAALSAFDDTVDGPGCAAGVEVVGAEGSQATGRRVLSAVCQLLERDEFAAAERGMAVWQRGDALLRLGVFERNGVESSARLEGGRLVIELGAKFEFEDAVRATPTLLHELVHIGSSSWPGAPVTAEDELVAITLQDTACRALRFDDDEPRACLDARELLATPDPLAALEAAGYRRAA